MNKAIFVVCTAAIVCACDANYPAAEGQFFIGSKSVSDMLKAGNLNACAHPNVEAFITEKAKEDVEIPTMLVSGPDGSGALR